MRGSRMKMKKRVLSSKEQAFLDCFLFVFVLYSLVLFLFYLFIFLMINAFNTKSFLLLWPQSKKFENSCSHFFFLSKYSILVDLYLPLA